MVERCLIIDCVTGSLPVHPLTMNNLRLLVFHLRKILHRGRKAIYVVDAALLPMLSTSLVLIFALIFLFNKE